MLFLSKAKNIILDLLFPNCCMACGQDGAYLCERCSQLLVMRPPVCVVCAKMVPAGERTPAGRTCVHCQSKSSVYAFFSPFLFEEKIVRDLVYALKYKRARAIGEFLGTRLADYIRRYGILLPKGALVVPIPLHKSRERTRGFNQSELIALGFIEKAGKDMLRLESKLLKRAKKTKPQTELSGTDREFNMQEAFQVEDTERVRGKIILLLDDVKTTGATLEEAARTLRAAGAKQIWAITVAH